MVTYKHTEKSQKDTLDELQAVKTAMIEAIDDVIRGLANHNEIDDDGLSKEITAAEEAVYHAYEKASRAIGNAEQRLADNRFSSH